MYGVLVEAAREAGGYVLASEVVSPRRRADLIPSGPKVRPLRARARVSRRHRRRRRPGTIAAVPPALGPDGGPLAPAAGAEGQIGQPARRRRRRRRRGGSRRLGMWEEPSPGRTWAK